MSKILTTAAVLMFILATTALAAPSQDFRSPDARAVVVTQDFRAPDARPAAAQPSTQDLRSPDGQVSGRFYTGEVADPARASSSFDWAYLAIVVAIPLLLLAGYLVTVRRGRDTVAIGG
jgi:hypothetical protein